MSLSHHISRTRRRQFALDEMAKRGNITRSLAGVMREICTLPKRMADAMTIAPRCRSRPPATGSV